MPDTIDFAQLGGGDDLPIDQPPSLSQANYWSADQDTAPYLAYACAPEYRWNSGNTVQPVADQDGADAAVIKLNAASGSLTLHFLAVRDNKPPLLPDPAPVDDRQIFLEARIVPGVTLMPDGKTIRFTAQGEYVYALTRPITPAQGFKLPKAPYTTIPTNNLFFGPENFRADVMGWDGGFRS